MKKKKRVLSLILAFAMVFTTMLGSMTVSSFAATGPVMVDYSVACANTDPNTEAGSEVIITVNFDQDIKITNSFQNGLNVSINGSSLATMKFQSPVITASGKSLIIDIKGMSNAGMVLVISGKLDIELAANYYEDLMSSDGTGKMAEWHDIHTYIPTGLAFKEGGSVTGTSTTPASVTFDLTGAAKLRGMSPVQILVDNSPIVCTETITTTGATGGAIETTYGGNCDSRRGTVNVHTHTYLTSTNVQWATALASNFYSKDYTMTASGSSVTLTAKNAVPGQDLGAKTVMRPFAYASPNDQVVQPILFDSEITAAEARSSAITGSTKVSTDSKEALINAIADAKSAQNGINDSTKAIEYLQMRAALKTAVDHAADNAITSTSVARRDGSATIKLVGGADWMGKINKISIDGNEIPSGSGIYTVNTNSSSITFKSSAFTSTDRNKNYQISIESTGYDPVVAAVNVTYYGANTFYIRYVDGNGNVIKSKAYTKQALIDMAQKTNGNKDIYFNTACSMTGLRTFKAKGVYLTDILSDANIKFGAGMSVKLRTNDSVKGTSNDPTNENAYYERSTMTYERLMQDRYWFPDLYTTSTLAEIAAEEESMTDTMRAALGSSTTKQKVNPAITYEYIEKVYQADKSSPAAVDYDQDLASDMSFRFLLGTAMDAANPAVAAEERTTWLVSYQTFGIDIIDPNYVAPNNPSGSGSGGSGSVKTPTPTTTTTTGTGISTTTGSGINTPVTNAIAAFKDIPSNSWYADYVGYLAGKGIVNGTSDTTFEPKKQITRAEFVKIIASIAKADVSGYSSTSFNDVNSADWYAKYIAWACDKGIVSGADKGTFNPNGNISRQDMAVIIQRYVENAAKTQLKKNTGEAAFADNNNIASYAKDAVSMMQQAGIINGREGNLFAPTDHATRAEACKMLTILMKEMDK